MEGVLFLRDPEDVEVILHVDHTVGESIPRPSPSVLSSTEKEDEMCCST